MNGALLVICLAATGFGPCERTAAPCDADAVRACSRHSSLASPAVRGPLAGPPATSTWIGADKIKHFFVSAFIQTAAFSAARAAGLSRRDAHLAGGVASTTIGVLKERHDRRRGGPFSVADLAWDLAGAGAAAALLNHAR